MLITYCRLPDRLKYLIDNDQQYLLKQGLKGIEKESLRITEHASEQKTDYVFSQYRP